MKVFDHFVGLALKWLSTVKSFRLMIELLVGKNRISQVLPNRLDKLNLLAKSCLDKLINKMLECSGISNNENIYEYNEYNYMNITCLTYNMSNND